VAIVKDKLDSVISNGLNCRNRDASLARENLSVGGMVALHLGARALDT
jgi:hypothetical protein